jgi:23S rRNA pseudouridine2605 synthase
MASERLQKLLAQAGVASRRAAEELITAGRVRVNGRIVTELGSRADAHKDKIEVDGRRVVAEKPAYYVLHKPREVVTTLDDPEGRTTIRDLIKQVPERVFPIGRLDYHTSGVLLLTNDGSLADALLHPRKQVPKTYVAKVQGWLEVPELDKLRNGVVLDDGTKTASAELFVIREEGQHTWLQITIGEGKNRQIHRMAEAINRRVMRLSRIEFAGISLDGLRPGQHRPLELSELNKLKRDYLNPKNNERAGASRGRRGRGERNAGYGESADMEAAPVKAPAGRAPRPPRREAPASGGGAGAGSRTRTGGRTGAGSRARTGGSASGAAAGAAKRPVTPRKSAGRKKSGPRKAPKP